MSIRFISAAPSRACPGCGSAEKYLSKIKI